MVQPKLHRFTQKRKPYLSRKRPECILNVELNLAAAQVHSFKMIVPTKNLLMQNLISLYYCSLMKAIWQNSGKQISGINKDVISRG